MKLGPTLTELADGAAVDQTQGVRQSAMFICPKRDKWVMARCGECDDHCGPIGKLSVPSGA